MTPPGLVSVIIPTLNEGERLGPLLAALGREAGPLDIIVCDGGSTDDTLALAARAGVRILRSAQGRGAQMAAGAAEARGEIFWFLHADSILGPGAVAAIRRALADPPVIGGNFRLIFDGEDAFSAWLTGFYAWFRRYGLFYGDSGIFLRAEAYRRIGGMKALPIMEDYDLRHRMKKAGPLALIENPALVTSSRRFRGRHPAAIVWGWCLAHGLFALRVPPSLIAWLYDSARTRRGCRHG